MAPWFRIPSVAYWKTDDGGRLQAAIKAAEGKLLFFYEPAKKHA